jgi:hypothetical protein
VRQRRNGSSASTARRCRPVRVAVGRCSKRPSAAFRRSRYAGWWWQRDGRADHGCSDDIADFTRWLAVPNDSRANETIQPAWSTSNCRSSCRSELHVGVGHRVANGVLRPHDQRRGRRASNDGQRRSRARRRLPTQLHELTAPHTCADQLRFRFGIGPHNRARRRTSDVGHCGHIVAANGRCATVAYCAFSPGSCASSA